MENPDRPHSPLLVPVLLALAAAAVATIPFARADAPQAGGGPYTIKETGKTFGKLQEAVDAIGTGTGTIMIAPGLYHDCAVQTAGDVSYVAEEVGKVVFDTTICEDKGAIVMRGYNANVSGITFQNMNSKYSGNAVGVRMEKGNLTVAQSWFKDSQQGILAGDDPNGRIVVDKSTFTNLGTCAYSGGCAHSIYVGGFGLVRVTRSRFEKGAGGHYLKTRSARVEIASNSFDDSHGTWSNYMIDLSNGATGQITNNWFVYGRDHENRTTFISVAPEGKKNPSDGLVIAGNDARLGPGVDWTPAFVADWSGDRLQIGTNTLGPGIVPYMKK
jgi:hypothetical protein